MGKAKIGRIRLKSGGAEIRIFSRPEERRVESELRSHVEELIGREEPMTGFVVFATYNAAEDFQLGYMSTVKCPIPETLFPSFVADALRRRLFEPED